MTNIIVLDDNETFAPTTGCYVKLQATSPRSTAQTISLDELIQVYLDSVKGAQQ